jgi:hypothetical protein
MELILAVMNNRTSCDSLVWTSETSVRVEIDPCVDMGRGEDSLHSNRSGRIKLATAQDAQNDPVVAKITLGYGRGLAVQFVRSNRAEKWPNSFVPRSVTGQ